MNIEPQLFVACMEERWRGYGNVVSDPLRAVWAEIAECMSRQIRWPTLPRPVIPAELGAGKSTSAKLYATLWAHGARDEHPGILIVVRTTEQAEEYARDINEWSRENTALAWYTKQKPRPSREEIARFPTVVICHRQYELALDEHMVDKDERLDKFTQFYGGARRLVIVDEALEQVYIAHIRQRNLAEIRRLSPARLVKEHRVAFELLQAVDRALMRAPANGNAVVAATKLLDGTGLTVLGADLVLQRLWESLGEQVHDLDHRAMVRETLTAVRQQLGCYAWTESEKSQTDLVSSRLLLPPGAGQVFLDATGALNNVYRVRRDQFEIRPVPQVRDYRRVTYYHASVKKTGKWMMKKEGERVATETLEAVLAHYGNRASERRVLVVTDKDSEPVVNQVFASGPFAELASAHWGAIDGRNCWRDFDTLVMLTIPWATRTLDLANWIATSGVELDNDGLNDPPDGVRRAREFRVASERVQAMGRLRLRQMIHEDGTSEPCDVFDRLAHGWAVNALDPENVIAGICSTMKGVRTVEWFREERSPGGRPPKARRKIEEHLLAMAREMKPGRQEIDRKSLGWSNGSIARALVNATTSGHPFQAELAAVGVRAERGGYRDGLRGQAMPALVKE
jgi:hypothetical protein